MNFLRTVPRLNAPIAAYSPLHCRFFVAAAAWTISDVVKEDHRELKAYYHKMIGEHDTDTKERYKNQFSWLLAKHAVGEEIVLYPAYEKYMGAFGKQAADKDRMSHQVTKDHLEYFQRIYPSSAEFEPKLRELMSKLSKHIQAEEEVELPILEKALSEHDKPMSGDVRETTKLAKSFRRTQLFIPSRAHPWMPNKPPFESVVGLLFTPFDTLGDMFRKFPDDADLDRTEGEYMEWKDEHRAED